MMEGIAVAWICLGVLFLGVIWLALVRIIRQNLPFPVPYFMVLIIDNPVRRLIQPLHKHPDLLGIEPGAKVLEIGPGSGTFTLAAAQATGAEGSLVAVDIEPRVVAHVRNRVAALGVPNIEVWQGDAQALEFEEAAFDAVFAITVYGEIPDRTKALSEFWRVLIPGGTLAISEFLLDPDSQPARRIREECESTGFHFLSKAGNLLQHTLLFKKPG